jgi:capsular exopolysaccharide synthesis family protein
MPFRSESGLPPTHKLRDSVPRFDVESPVAIELRRVMIRIGRQLDLERKRSLVVTSAILGEGKSLFSLFFSLVLAYHSKQRILLVDGDMRRPVQHKIFGVPRGPGLSDDLSAIERTQIPVHRTEIGNLFLLPAGIPAQSPSQLLGENRFARLMAQLQEKFDIVIVDAPPVVPVSDPLHYVPAVDGVLFIVMAGRTRKDVARRGIDILKGAGARILGVVANNYPEVLPYYYDSKYYGYEPKGRSDSR